MNILASLLPLQAAGGMGMGWETLILFGGVFLVMYFLVVRPQKKKEKETKAMLEAMKKGDKVISIGGIRGTVKQVKDDTVIVVIDNKDNTLEFNRSAIATVLDPSKESAKKEDAQEDASSEDSAESEE